MDNLTSEQRTAVENEGGALLVSAAAGSGKTRVLVERLMRKISSGSDINDFLIITYTNAAAAELRGKILDAIYERIADDPENLRLHRQVNLCGRAEIETIHSFCLGLIRDNVNLLGLTPDVRVADETESNAIRQDVLEKLLEERYNSGDKDFLALADTMGAGRDDRALVSVVLDTHSKLLSHPDPADWVARQIDALNLDGVTDAGETIWGRELMERAARTTKYWHDRMTELIAGFDEDDPFSLAYGASISVTIEDMEAFMDALSRSWDEARNCDVRFPRAKSVSGYDGEKDTRAQCRKAMDKLREQFHDTSEKVLSDMRAAAPTSRAALKLVLMFDEAYSDAKRRNGVLDFSDQEHLALRLLRENTELASEVARRFDEILIDEYQDVNAIQEAIFNLISRDGQNLFMVGDVKQSIYRFRLADPSIFTTKFAAFRDAEEASDGEPRRLTLSRNFRSRAGILEAANYIFANVMTSDFGDVDYTEREYLYPGLDFPDMTEPCLELDVIDASDAEDDKSDMEARFAAQRVLELVGTFTVSDSSGAARPARFGDIAVLMRSPKSRLPIWSQTFARFGIPVHMDTYSDIFEELEVSVTLSLLAIIDNPHQDIPLAAVLESPIYGFTADDLGRIRASNREGDFYDALIASAENDNKCASFIKSLSELRAIAPNLSIDRLLWHIYNETGLFAIVSAMPGGDRRRQNLMVLFEYARKFDKAGFHGLFGFVSYMRKVREEGVAGNTSAQADDAVRFMSVHKSKGLEFPIVILADTTHRFNTEDTRKPLLVHPELGVGTKVVDIKRKITYPTIARQAVGARLRLENLSEELRVLYVAVTRAREKLIVLSSYANATRELARLGNIPLPVPPEVLSNARSCAEWILIPALHRPESGALCPVSNISTCDDGAWRIRIINTVPDSIDKSLPEEELEEDVDAELVQDIENMLDFRYPYADATTLSSKLTATELKGTFRDAETEDSELLIAPISGAPPMRPRFMTGKRGLTPAERGTAAHIVMQFADYAKCGTDAGVAGEIERLVSNRTITREQADAVQPTIIRHFFESDTGQFIMSADKIWRELKFSLLVDAGELLARPTGSQDSSMAEFAAHDERQYISGEQVLLQGVVDLCVLKDGYLTVVDFKTDYVTEATIADRADFYSGQVSAYAMAMEKVLKYPVRETLLCFLLAGKNIVIHSGAR